jgi:ZIP family zinc transporter
VVGGSVATFFQPSPTVRSILQHFAAGVVFYAVAVELLPDVLKRDAPVAVVIGFALGTILMLGIRWFTRSSEKKNKGSGGKSRLPFGLLVAIGLNFLIDGLVVGLGFVVGSNKGFILTAALSIDNLFLGLASASSLTSSGVSKVESVLVHSGLGLLIVIGGVVGVLVLGGVPNAELEAVLAFGVAALLYLVTEELLVEAHEAPESPLTASTFFVGFLAFLLVEMLTSSGSA